MKVRLVFLIIILIFLSNSCSKEKEKISIVEEESLEMQMIKAYKEGLKEIAQYLGFSWTLDDVDAMGSIALFTDFVESEGKDLESKIKILTYNEDDCQATKFIFDWLNSELVS